MTLIRPYVVLAWVEDHLNKTSTAIARWGGTNSLQNSDPLADAVAYLHRQSIEHRDIKAINVLADSARRPLADFGIAKQHDESTSTQTVSNFGRFSGLRPKGRPLFRIRATCGPYGVMCIYGLAPKDGRPKNLRQIKRGVEHIDTSYWFERVDGIGY